MSYFVVRPSGSDAVVEPSAGNIAYLPMWSRSSAERSLHVVVPGWICAIRVWPWLCSSVNPASRAQRGDAHRRCGETACRARFSTPTQRISTAGGLVLAGLSTFVARARFVVLLAAVPAPRALSADGRLTFPVSPLRQFPPASTGMRALRRPPDAQSLGLAAVERGITPG
jgi:hypothetical protein